MIKLKLALLVPAMALVLAGCRDEAAAPPLAPAAKPALTVTAVAPQRIDWPLTLAAGGNVAAWQEAIIGPELGNYRLTEVRVNVGDRVRKGDVLARIASDAVDSELAETRASVAEAAATLREARANQERARQLRAQGFYSPQQAIQSQTVAETALARLNAAQARLRSAELRRSKVEVVAPDDGLISARTATVGSLTQPGQELFRLIRGGRLEWRAEVTAADLVHFKPGLPAQVVSPSGAVLAGRVRGVAPTVDPQTRQGLVYVDLPGDAAPVLSAGMFASGQFEIGRRSAWTLPQSAVQLREGFAYVFRLEAADDPANESLAKVRQAKVDTGRRQGERIEITGGLDPDARVVASGGAFLADGDSVRLAAAGQAQ
ncbi:efflux RND transporter periplasmic adaptor subunit [Accumulibacter sp.]|uniref:efflux RND transporter periplasmic adaptor subunit n=1 Tax=Accumulibacter sp. TaxID=2053492 RepID=UPI0026042529|nr:efflux RND transporter periplasmic adaptor subunit [Accumulibacter sp.]